MSCYFRHMGSVFKAAGIEVTPDNKQEVDRAVHRIAGVPYKDCPRAWSKVKEMIKEEPRRQELVEKLRASMRDADKPQGPPRRSRSPRLN